MSACVYFRNAGLRDRVKANRATHFPIISNEYKNELLFNNALSGFVTPQSEALRGPQRAGGGVGVRHRLDEGD